MTENTVREAFERYIETRFIYGKYDEATHDAAIMRLLSLMYLPKSLNIVKGKVIDNDSGEQIPEYVDSPGTGHSREDLVLLIRLIECYVASKSSPYSGAAIMSRALAELKRFRDIQRDAAKKEDGHPRAAIDTISDLRSALDNLCSAFDSIRPLIGEARNIARTAHGEAMKARRENNG